MDDNTGNTASAVWQELDEPTQARILGAGRVFSVVVPVARVKGLAEIGKKSKNKPPAPLNEAEGRAHTIIEKAGSKGQYTTHYDDGTWKQYRGSGTGHGGIPRPNVKETELNTAPDGKTFVGRGKVRPAQPEEIPGGK